VTTIVHHRDFRPFKSRPLDPSNPHGVIEDGEALSFDIMFRDAASKPTSATAPLDAERERAVSVEVGRAMAQHHLRFAFMGDRAPAFDRARAEFLARQRLTTDAQAASARSTALAAARHQEAAYQASKTGLNSWRGGHDAARHADATANAASLRDALRIARYSGN
jgi:hypothetical protein